MTDLRGFDPMHAKKMAALMQAEAADGMSRERPILLRIEPKAGHGVGKPVTKQIEELADVYSFLFWRLGVRGWRVSIPSVPTFTTNAKASPAGDIALIDKLLLGSLGRATIA